MKRIAIVVQRCHHTIVGGSETLAWQYAMLLKDKYDVDVLTTTALDYSDWANALPPGEEVREGVTVRRFPVTIGRTAYWSALHHRLSSKIGAHVPAGDSFTAHQQFPWRVALQEEFIKHQGPYSEPLLQFIQSHWPNYKTIIFVTYLYPTSYFGLQRVPRNYALFVPTLHDEMTAYLPVYQHAARRARSLLWLTHAERRVGLNLWGDLPGRIVALDVDTALSEPPTAKEPPYLLYCGRIDANKGCLRLFEHFIRYKKQHPSNLRLILTGEDNIPVPEHAEIEFRGFVSKEEKLKLMSGASVFVMPSGNESFSIVTLEAMAQRTPVLTYGASQVLTDHILLSGAGRIYLNYKEFAAALYEMLSAPNELARMGALGRDYVVSRYQREHVQTALIEAVESCRNNNKSSTKVATRENNSHAVEKSDREPPLPLPENWSQKKLREFVTSIELHGGPLPELRQYASEDFKRFVYTLGLVPDEPNLAMLELGANPYFITTLLRKFRSAKLRLANFFSQSGERATQEITIRQTGENISYDYEQFNVEQDVFPYDDDSFDVVLFCEIIEHLLSDPVHALTEIRRVLKPDGFLVLTTPNAARLENVCRMVAGENTYDPYSGYGPYGRHNREYTKHDLFRLLTANGFNVETLFTADVHKDFADTYSDVGAIKPLVAHRRSDLGQYIFCRSFVERKSKHDPPSRPDWLYRSFH